MNARFGVIIPARYGSTRLPGKPLRLIAGVPMIEWVVRLASRSGAEFVTVATDDERIMKAVSGLGFDAVLTSAEHPTGTDRLAEVVQKKNLSDDTIVVNVQGDEPLLPPEFISLVAQSLASHERAALSTLAVPLTSAAELIKPSIVKVVRDEAGYALTFSRAPVPWVRDAFATEFPPRELPAGVPFLRHIGLYAYRAGTLRRWTDLEPTPLERAESLEQLRALGNGLAIHVSVSPHAPPHGVDTEEDLKNAEKAITARS